MRKTIIYAILLLLSLKIQSRSQTHIQDNDSIQLFRTFLKSFADYDKRDIDSGIFGNAAYEKGMDKGKYGMFLPENNNCDCPEEEIYWQAGSVIQKEGIIVAFMKRFCFEDEYESFCDYIAVTYTKEGSLTDSKMIGRTGRLYRCEIEGDLNHISMTAECGELLNKEQLRDYGDLMYAMEKKKFTVSKDGKITEKKVGKQWIESVVQKDGIVEKVEFEDYMNFFSPLENDKVSEEWLFGLAGKELEYSYTKTFIPDSADCECERRNLLWYPLHKQTHNDFIAVFMEKLCDLPKEGCMYRDFLIMTYSKDGKMTDMQRIARLGDLWAAQIDESSTTSSLLVRQGFIDEVSVEEGQSMMPIEIVETRYDIMPDGKIHRNTVRTYNSTCHWDEKQCRLIF